jgi:hypothetical protein
MRWPLTRFSIPRAPAPVAAEPTLDGDTLPAGEPPGPPRHALGLLASVDAFLFDEQVSTESVLTLLRRAYFDVEVSEHGWLVVKDDRGLRVIVFVDRERRLLAMQMRFTLRQSATWLHKLEFANRANDRLVFARFAVPDATTLVCDHQLVFDGGLAPRAVVTALRRLMRVVSEWILLQSDRDDVLAR